MADIIQLPGTERDVVPLQVADTIPVKNVINEEVANKLDIGLVIGRDKNDEFYFASSDPDMGKILILLERAKRVIVDNID